MLRCNTCMARCIRVLLADALRNTQPVTKPPTRPSCRLGEVKKNSHPLSWSQSWRCYASSAVNAQVANQEDPASLFPHFTLHKQRAIAQRLTFNKAALQLELRHLKDPLKLAEHVVNLLRHDENSKALELVRLNSKNAACTVSWNHLIDYEMHKGGASKAVSLYNEMKKRAQIPDSHTFTILFRGLAMRLDQPQALGHALSIYQSMYAQNCPVKPSIVHTNALLNVCARFKDIDALYGVAAKLPSYGAGAADNLTFTTIMNAIRVAASEEVNRESHEEKTARRQRAILQGRRMWGDIIDRWKKGDIRIDEGMVCSMGRLLLLGYLTRDCDDILSLVQQTMGIPRQTPQSKHPDRLIHLKQHHVTTEDRLPKLVTQELASAMKYDNEIQDDEPSGEFNSVSNHQLSFTRPGCNTLSMVIDACMRLNAIRPAQDYWKLFTDPSGPYKITPDAENYHFYLRLLRIQRASRLSVKLIQDIRNSSDNGKSILKAKSFRIALSTCVRDSNNPNVLDNASKLVQMMHDTLEMPDVPALEMYLEVARHPRNRDWRTLIEVLRGPVLGFQSLQSHLANSSHERDAQETQLRSEHDQNSLLQKGQEIERLARKLIGVHDVVLKLGEEEMSTEQKSDMQQQKSLLAAWVTKMSGMNEDKEQPQQQGLTEPWNFEPSTSATESPMHTRASTYRDAAHRRQYQRASTTSSSDKTTWRINPRPIPTLRDPTPADASPADSSPKKALTWRRFPGSTYRPSDIHKRRIKM